MRAAGRASLSAPLPRETPVGETHAAAAGGNRPYSLPNVPLRSAKRVAEPGADFHPTPLTRGKVEAKLASPA